MRKEDLVSLTITGHSEGKMCRWKQYIYLVSLAEHKQGGSNVKKKKQWKGIHRKQYSLMSQRNILHNRVRRREYIVKRTVYIGRW